jgi:hypothetical protein
VDIVPRWREPDAGGYFGGYEFGTGGTDIRCYWVWWLWWAVWVIVVWKRLRGMDGVERRGCCERGKGSSKKRGVAHLITNTPSRSWWLLRSGIMAYRSNAHRSASLMAGTAVVTLHCVRVVVIFLYYTQLCIFWIWDLGLTDLLEFRLELWRALWLGVGELLSLTSSITCLLKALKGTSGATDDTWNELNWPESVCFAWVAIVVRRKDEWIMLRQEHEM